MPVDSQWPSFFAATAAVVIIGGVAGGATAAARSETSIWVRKGDQNTTSSHAVRRLTETAKITIIERGPDVSFANCGLPYYVGDGKFTGRKTMVLRQRRQRLPFLIRQRLLTVRGSSFILLRPSLRCLRSTCARTKR